MKKNKNLRCNHCGGVLRKYMDGEPTCLTCGRYISHSCKDCISYTLSKPKNDNPKRLAA